MKRNHLKAKCLYFQTAYSTTNMRNRTHFKQRNEPNLLNLLSFFFFFTTALGNRFLSTHILSPDQVSLHFSAYSKWKNE